MRNELAHGGRISDDRVRHFLEAHAARFEALMGGLELFSADAGVALVASPECGPAWQFCGLTTLDTAFDCSTLPEEFRQAGPDRMLLVAPGGVLDLCPLHAYGEVFQVVKDQLQGQGEEALQMYARAGEPAGVEYTALGGRASSSRGSPAWEKRFAEIFRLEAWRARFRVQDALAKYSFGERMDGLLRLFIGRDEQVAAAAARIEALDSGVFWLSGKPGMGKSAFMAKLVRDYFQREAETRQPRADLITIPYFFQAQDGERCRTSAFAEAALLYLARATDEVIKPEADPDERLHQLRTVLGERAAAESAGRKRKIVVFVDGVDEVMGVDGRLLDLVFRYRHPGVVWVCASRDEEPLRQRFSRPQCRWFFERASDWAALRVAQAEDEGLLPPLRVEGIRGYFIEELGHRLPQFFGRDTRQGDTWSNEYVEEVIRRSDGLPLYLRLLVQDIRKDPTAFAPGSEQRLPRGLEEYYDRIIDEMGDDLAATMPAITTLLALGHEPLPVETLAVLLGDHELVGQADGRQLLEEALRHGSVMLRRAPTSSGVLGYTLYHESFKQHVLDSERIRRSRAKAQERLCNLATHWSQLERTSVPLGYALRWGPRILIRARQWDALAALLIDLDFLEAKTWAGLVFELAGDFFAAVKALPEDQPQRRILRLLDEALRRDIHFIHYHREDYPQGLFQCLWNTCWWYDCDDAPAHYIEPDRGWNVKNAPWL